LIVCAADDEAVIDGLFKDDYTREARTGNGNRFIHGFTVARCIRNGDFLDEIEGASGGARRGRDLDGAGGIGAVKGHHDIERAAARDSCRTWGAAD
jgi:hypothetical protein